jgi:hypothetical protein
MNSIICGYGVISGHTVNGCRQPQRTVPDIISINLGTNDYFYTGSDATKEEEFKEGYINFSYIGSKYFQWK